VGDGVFYLHLPPPRDSCVISPPPPPTLLYPRVVSKPVLCVGTKRESEGEERELVWKPVVSEKRYLRRSFGNYDRKISRRGHG